MPFDQYLRNRLLARRAAIKRPVLLNSALRAISEFPSLERSAAARLGADLVVSLTSYPPRFGSLASTLKSLLLQSVSANKIILWIAHGDINKLPPSVTALEGLGVDILPCDDLRSYKKLVPALNRFPNCTIVTADDDIYYPRGWLSSLIDTHLVNPHAVVCHRAHMARFRADGSIRRYNEWIYETPRLHSERPDQAIFPTGVGGILYPSGSLPMEASDMGSIRELCPYGDDIWFFWMARMANVKHVRVPGYFDVIDWPGSQAVSLNSDNVGLGRNDAQLTAIEKALGFICSHT